MSLRNFSYLIPDEVAGMAKPGDATDLETLARLGFQSLVSLEDFDVGAAPRELRIYSHPLPDFCRIPVARIHAAVEAVRLAPRKVGVHCGGGYGRTGVVLACYLVTLGRTPREAIDEVRERRPDSIDHDSLELSIYDYAEDWATSRGTRSGRRDVSPSAPVTGSRGSRLQVSVDPDAGEKDRGCEPTSDRQTTKRRQDPGSRGATSQGPSPNDGPTGLQGDARSSVFLMMRFRDAEPYDELAGTLRTILDEYSLKLRRADWKQHADLLWDNVRHYMDRSAYGIAIFDRLGADEVSPNVCLELGYMIARQRPCLLLKERSVPALQADLAGHLFVDFDLEDIRETVGAGVRSWLEDVGVAKRKGERMVVFVSEGGTCRDPMAKAITLDLLARRSGSLPLRVEALAKGEPSGSTASDGARTAIRELYGTDLLANHRTARLTPTAISDADLILVMERRMLKGLPPDKSFAIGRFFLEQDMDIQDPWSDQYDEASLARYRACAAELQKLITENFDRLLDRFRPT